MARERSRTEHLREGRIERADAVQITRALLPIALFGDVLSLLLQWMRGMPERVRKPEVLREKQERADELQQRPFEARWCVRRGIDRCGHAEAGTVAPRQTLVYREVGQREVRLY